jgi:hypothetical protein
MIDNIAPEEFLISTDARSVNPKDARFTAHYTEKTVSELRQMGFTDDEIVKMENGITHSDLGEEAFSRNNLSDEERWDDAAEANEAMQTKKITECYIYADANGDGVAEMLQVFRSGEFIKWEEVDKNPFNAITPVILTHKFFGLSVADLLRDLQEIRTAVIRAYLDNFNQTINGTTYYNENTVNVEDMLTSQPFGIRAVDGPPGQDILHIPPGSLPPQAFSMMEMLDKLRTDRIGDFQSQLDPQVLANANNGVVVEMMNEAKGKVEMIARIFAETGVKELFRDIHDRVREVGDEEEIVKLRGQWVPINPAKFCERTDFTVKVGLGNRDRQEEAASIMAIMDKQMQLMQVGGLAPIHIDPQTGQPMGFPLYESAKRFAEIMGEKNPDRFFPHPMTIPPPPPDTSEQDAIMMMAQVEEAKNQTKQVEIQMKHQNEQLKLQLEGEKIKAQAAEAAAKQDTAELKLQMEQFKMVKDQEVKELKALLDAQNSDNKASQDEIKLAIETAMKERDRELEKYKADLQASTTITTSDSAPPEVKAAASDNVMAALLDGLNAIQTKLNAPKQVIRDENGQIIQVGDQRVIRDDSGLVQGLE